MPPKRKRTGTKVSAFYHYDTANQENLVQGTSTNLGANAGLPRINDKLSVTDLKEELKARGVHMKEVLGLTRTRGLQLLRVGSIHLSGTEEYRKFQKLRSLMEAEEAAVARNSESVVRICEEAVAEKEKEPEREAAAQARLNEQESQKLLHVVKVPVIVHRCLMAHTGDLKIGGKCRLKTAKCGFAGIGRCSGPIKYTCEKCDFDVCDGCYMCATAPLQVMPEEERRALLETEEVENRKPQEREKARVAKEFREKWAEYRRGKKEYEYEQLSKQAKDMEDLFEERNLTLTDGIMNLSKDCTDRKRPKNFVVWSCEAETDDRNSIKEFDSSFDTLREANSRALLKFWAQNPWGLAVDTMLTNMEEMGDWDWEEETTRGALTLRTAPPDAGLWTVGVAPEAASEHLQIRAGGHSGADWGQCEGDEKDDDDDPPCWYDGQAFEPGRTSLSAGVFGLGGLCAF